MSQYSGSLGSSVRCPECAGPCMVRWVVEGGWYANDPFGSTRALVQAHHAVVTPEERRTAVASYAALPLATRVLCEKIKAERNGHRLSADALAKLEAATAAKANAKPKRR